MASLAYIVARGNRCRATYWFRKAGNGRSVITGITLYGVRSDVDKTEAIWTAMETSRAVMWRERARTTRNAKANAAWRNGYYQGFQEEIAHRYEILRREMESDDTGRNWSPSAPTRSTRGSKPTSHSPPSTRNWPGPPGPAAPPTGMAARTDHARRSA